MTTNSPNQVDGDVQALISDCQAEIAEIEKRLTTWGEAWIPYLQSKLKRQQVALAALTAEPVIYAIQNEDERKSGSISEFSIFGIAGYVNPEKYGLTELALYTTPPAQLLRPVELPKRKSMLTREGVGEDYTTCMAIPLDDVIAALENAGVPYEVK